MVEKQELDMSFEEPENFGSAESQSIQQIVLRQLQKCTQAASTEMSAGGLMTRVINGMALKIPEPNQRQIFINSVEMLRILIIPEMEKNKKIIEPFLAGFEEKLKFLAEKRNKEIIILNRLSNQANEQVANSVRNPHSFLSDRASKQPTINPNEFYNNQLEIINNNHELGMVRLYKDKLLTAISFLLDHINYFEERRGSAR